mmetsp:Transcript_151883/g.264675  ORF Transcript_151883/g.264675 Transcript_151883/m.264675 type:complete len:228 (+) Transcript_151883:37-720(+)
MSCLTATSMLQEALHAIMQGCLTAEKLTPSPQANATYLKGLDPLYSVLSVHGIKYGTHQEAELCSRSLCVMASPGQRLACARERATTNAAFSTSKPPKLAASHVGTCPRTLRYSSLLCLKFELSATWFSCALTPATERSAPLSETDGSSNNDSFDPGTVVLDIDVFSVDSFADCGGVSETASISISCTLGSDISPRSNASLTLASLWRRLRKREEGPAVTMPGCGIW